MGRQKFVMQPRKASAPGLGLGPPNNDVLRLLLAQSGHPDALNQCPLSGVKRTSKTHFHLGVFSDRG
jgi:hypothetical protein